MIHTVKGFSIVDERQVDVFLEFPCFLYDPENVGTLISAPLLVLNPARTHFSRFCAIRLKMFSLFFVFVFLCIIFVESITNLFQYGTK